MNELDLSNINMSLTDHTIKVLLVDDQKLIGKAIQKMLEDESDIKFHHCMDSRRAIHVVNKIQPTVILQDLIMPHFDGLTLVHLYRKNTIARHIPLIVLSAKEAPKTKAEAFAAGANDYMVKLPDKLEIIARIRYHSQSYINRLQRDEAFRTAQLETEKRAAETAARNAEKLRAEMLSREIDTQKAFIEAFIKTIGTAIDEKSPYTGGHVKRVVNITMMMAKAINQSQSEHFKDIHFSDEELEEIQLAAWMHDVGKITTPEHIINKATRLETICDRIHLIEIRFMLIEQHLTIEFMKSQDSNDTQSIEQFRSVIASLRDDFEFLKVCNHPDHFVSKPDMIRIQKIGKKTFKINGIKYRFLLDDEVDLLCIQKGTLNTSERKIIKNHAELTRKLLEQLPFPEHLSRISEFAGGHHETLDGTGYPQGLSNNQIPIQTRIITIADIFEALTARDRPYKNSMSISQAIEILNDLKEQNKIDAQLVDLFINNQLPMEYGQNFLLPDQLV